MNLKITFLSMCIAASSFSVAAASEPAVQRERLQEVKRLLHDGDTTGTRQLLEKWSAENPADVELAIARANFYTNQATTTSLGIERGQSSSKDALAIRDKDTGEQIGFLGVQTRYDPVLLTKATSVLLDAVTSHPQRADIWMGAAHTCLLRRDYGGALDTLTSFVKYARKNPDKLTTAYGKPISEKAEEFMPETLHSYAVRGFEDETTAGRTFLLNVARMAQKEYPKHPYAYNDEAAYYNYIEDDEKVLDCLMRAHKIQPDDALIIFNIAGTYRNLHRPDKTREYLQLTIKTTDDEELKSTAQNLLDATKPQQ